MTGYQCSIITPTGKIFDQKVNALSARGTTGSFGVLSRHAPMVISLSNGPMNIKQEGKESFFAVSSGVLEINAKHDVIVLADSAIEANTYDEAKDAARKLKSNNLAGIS